MPGWQQNFLPADPLAMAVARAHIWQRGLDEGRYASVSALARAEGLDEAYLRRLLGLACLAPEVVHALLFDESLRDVSIRALVHAPVRWDEQRRRFGFSIG